MPDAGIEARPPRAAAIDHHPHARNGQRGFRDRGRQHDPPRGTGRGQHRALRLEIHRAVKRHDLHRQVGQAGGDAADLALAGQEGQDGAAGIVAGLGLGLGDQARGFDIEARGAGQGARQPAGFDRIGAAHAFDDGGASSSCATGPASSVADMTSSARSGRSALRAFP
jgi:hypothetical protein